MSNLRERIKRWASEPADSGDFLAIVVCATAVNVVVLILILMWGMQ